MPTITFSVTDEQKRIIKTKASFAGKTMKDFILEALGFIKSTDNKKKLKNK